MLAHRVFFSFAAVTDPARHRDYNEWHQLDHRPENLALDGVRWGERWVRPPACMAASRVADNRVAGVHYVNLYWFATPADRSIAEWQDLAERSFQWGRRPEGEWATRPLMGFFSTVQGYVSPRVKVSADALPFRPNRGVVVTLSRLTDPHGPAAARRFAWHDQVAIPALLADPGVAGAWTFSSDSTTLDPTWTPVEGSTTFDASGTDQGSLRMTVLFVDDDPLAVWHRLRSPAGVGTEEGPDSTAERVVFDAPLQAIIPWQWDWFD